MAGRRGETPGPPDYLDLVEVLARLEGDHVVGGDAGDGRVRGVLGSVESQRRLARSHLHNKQGVLTRDRSWSGLRRAHEDPGLT